MDLADIKLTLKEYFADRQVQTYLEQLSPPTVEKATVYKSVAAPPPRQEEVHSADEGSGLMSLWRNLFAGEKSAVTSASAGAVERELVNMSAIGNNRLSTVTIERSRAGGSASGSKSPGHKPAARGDRRQFQRGKSLSLPLQPKKTRAVPPSVMQKVRGKVHHQTRRKKRRPETLWKGWLFILGLIFGVGAISYLGMKLFLTPSNKIANKSQLAVALDRPVVEIHS